ncbi:MAG: SusC/RagA family TonB-linked outer membrane protein [Niabella sp.]
MKLAIFLVLFFSFQSFAFNGLGQERISLNIKNSSIENAIKTIEEKTNYRFVYDNSIIPKGKRIDLNANDIPIQQVLNQLLKETSLSYQWKSANLIVLVQDKIKPLPIIGKVIDKNGEPLANVSILEKGTSNGTTTLADGTFKIDVKDENAILIVSLVGYKEEEVSIRSKEYEKIVLELVVNQMNEVVVVGMGTQRRVSVVGAISSVKVSELKTASRSLTNSLAGRMAGVVAVQRSGEPGYDDASFWIRGISTFGANKTPLILVDGVERSMSNLDPEEIESVSILKDASATAVYGVRAANGVVIITTRKGKAASKPTVDFKSEYGVSELTRLPKLLDGVNYMTLYNEAAGKEVYSKDRIEKTASGEDPFLYPNVNWLDQIFKKRSDNWVTTLNVNGGGEVARYFIGGGVFSESGNFRNDPQNAYKSNIKLDRYNFRTNVDVSVTKSTLLNIELGGYLIDAHYPGTSTGDLFDKAMVSNPINIPVRYPYGTNEDGSTRYVWAGSNSATTENPAERLMGSGFATEYRNQLLGQARLTQDFGKIIGFLDGLKANVAFSFDAYNQTNISRKKKDSYYMANGRDPITDELNLIQTYIGNEYLGYDKSLGSNRAIELKAQINYDRTLGDHKLGAMVMYYQRDYRNGSAGSAITSLPYRNQGIAFRGTYSYLDRYLAEFNLGYNGSENFPKGQRFGLFPAVALGYVISNEKFWSESSLANVINMFKIRGSLGLVGAEALPNDRRYAYLTIVGGGLGNYRFGYDPSDYYGTGENQLGVSNLTWEKGLKSNIGFQSELFNRKVTLEVDYFHEIRSNILVQRNSLPGIVGINDAPFANLGKMRNQGFEGTLEMNQHFGDVALRVYGNATYTNNKILEQDEPDWKYTYQNRTGKKYGQQFGLVSLGYFKDEQEINSSPTQTFGTVRPGDIKYLDVNGDGVVDSYDEIAIGYSNIPELQYGFGFQVGFKGVDLAMFFRGQSRVSYMMGGEGFIPFKEGGDRGNLFEDALDRWTVDNPSQDAFYPRLSIGNTGNNYRNSTKWMYNGRFLRLADVEVGYNLPKQYAKTIHVNGVRLYFHGSNLALFSPFKMWDPEIGKGRGDAYPLQRKMNLGLRVNF